jgi:3-hydroxyisobutyrate dehydrogenase-like beta-hydroxyacid dehydrogenase
MDVGFVGLGRMGTAMAANLAKTGHAVKLWNRTPGKAGPAILAGALEVDSVSDAAHGEVVITMLADDAAVESVTLGKGGLLDTMTKGAIHVGMSTISVALAERLAHAHMERGAVYLSAPVFGRPPAAEAAALSIVVAGAPHAIETVQPLFDAMGKKTFVVGERPEAANLVKLCGNFMIMAAIEAMGEAMTVAVKGGVSKAALLEVLRGTMFDAPVYKNYGEILVEERYRPAGFTAPLGLKDMRLMAAAAEATRVPMPFLGVIRDHLLATVASEGDDVDWAAVGKIIARNAGLSG